MDLRGNFTATLDRISQALADCGREPHSVRLIAVSKTQPAAQVRALYELGQRDFGENYLQELAEKAEDLKHLEGIRWHFIGHVQSNKIKTICRYASAVHALADVRHARLLAAAAAAAGKARFPVYLAVNTGGELQKSGLEPARVPEIASIIMSEFPELDLRGIMSVPPQSYQDPATGPIAVPPLYESLATLADTVGQRELSLGMSADLKTAIYAGATSVRIGTALFGSRA